MRSERCVPANQRRPNPVHLQPLHYAARLLLRLLLLHAAAAAGALLPGGQLRRRAALRRQRWRCLRCCPGLQPAPGRPWPPAQALAALLRRQGRHCARAEVGRVHGEVRETGRARGLCKLPRSESRTL